MSTRGAFGFYVNGETKVTYNHYDSYIEGLGVDVFQALQRFFSFYQENKRYKKELKRVAESIVMIDSEKDYSPLDGYARVFFGEKILEELDNGKITDNFAKEIAESRKRNPHYPFSYIFETLGERYATKHDISFYLYEKNRNLEMRDGKDFLEDDLFCEYAYIINVDKGILEIYMSGANESIKPSRYKVDLVAEISFEDLNEMSLAKFIKKFTKIENEYRDKIE